MLSTLEVIVFVLYLTTIFMAVVTIMYLNPGRMIRESLQVEDTGEKFVQAEFEEPSSSESEESESEEEYIMEENPMLRQRHIVKEETQVEQKEVH